MNKIPEVLANILKKMDEISYGWIDIYGTIHHHSKRQYFIDNYRFMSIDKILESKVGTCFEQTALVSYYLNQEGIENHTYIIIYNDPDKIARHTVCIATYQDEYYLLESSWLINDDEIKYSNYEEILTKVIKRYPKMYKIDNFNKELIVVYEYTNPSVNMSYDEFCDNAKKGKKININL